MQQIRAAVYHLRDYGAEDLARVTLLSDGVNVFECTSAREVPDLLQLGKGIFGIALSHVRRELGEELAGMPAVRASDGIILRISSHPG